MWSTYCNQNCPFKRRKQKAKKRHVGDWWFIWACVVKFAGKNCREMELICTIFSPLSVDLDRQSFVFDVEKERRTFSYVSYCVEYNTYSHTFALMLIVFHSLESRGTDKKRDMVVCWIWFKQAFKIYFGLTLRATESRKNLR
jgi:hypothetical protein